MNRLTLIIAASFFSIGLVSCGGGKKVELFTGENPADWHIHTDTGEADPAEIFRMEDGILHTTGVPHAYIRTTETYKDFQLTLEWRWVDEPTNSGVLLHVQGEDRIWPLSTECQLMHGRAGDIVLIGRGSGITVRDTTYRVESEENRYRVIGRSEASSENTPGEWNTYRITSSDGNLEVVVNDVVQNRGTGLTLKQGFIALQSEGSPMEFRNIVLKPL